MDTFFITTGVLCRLSSAVAHCLQGHNKWLDFSVLSSEVFLAPYCQLPNRNFHQHLFNTWDAFVTLYSELAVVILGNSYLC